MPDDNPIERAIRHSLARIDENSAEARQKIYGAAMRALDRQQQSRSDQPPMRRQAIRRELVATIDLIEGEYRARSAAVTISDANVPVPENTTMTNPNQPASKGTRSIGVLALIVVLVSVAAYALSARWFASSSNAEVYDASPPSFIDAGAYVITPNAASVTVANKAERKQGAAPMPNFVLSSQWEQKFSGETIEVTISARAPIGVSSGEIVAVYYTDGLGNSGPKTFPLTSEYADTTFTYDVPERVGEGQDLMAVAPASDQAGASVDVRSIRIRTR